jgi:membrane-bound serine protease (ClpP class)
VAVGDRGVVVNPLRPSGKVEIGDEVFDVTTEGGFCDKGTPVTVTKVQGTRIVVERVESHDS